MIFGESYNILGVCVWGWGGGGGGGGGGGVWGGGGGVTPHLNINPQEYDQA